MLKNSPSYADVSMEEGIVPCANTLTLAHVHKTMKLVAWAPVFNIYARKSSTYIYIMYLYIYIYQKILFDNKQLRLVGKKDTRVKVFFVVFLKV